MTTNNITTKTERSIAEVFARNWWLLALRGVAAIMFGLLALIWPRITLLTLIYLFGAYALANGILSFAVALKARRGRHHWGRLADCCGRSPLRLPASLSSPEQTDVWFGNGRI